MLEFIRKQSNTNLITFLPILNNYPWPTDELFNALREILCHCSNWEAFLDSQKVPISLRDAVKSYGAKQLQQRLKPAAVEVRCADNVETHSQA